MKKDFKPFYKTMPFQIVDKTNHILDEIYRKPVLNDVIELKKQTNDFAERVKDTVSMFNPDELNDRDKYLMDDLDKKQKRAVDNSNKIYNSYTILLGQFAKDHPDIDLKQYNGSNIEELVEKNLPDYLFDKMLQDPLGGYGFRYGYHHEEKNILQVLRDHKPFVSELGDKIKKIGPREKIPYKEVHRY